MADIHGEPEVNTLIRIQTLSGTVYHYDPDNNRIKRHCPGDGQLGLRKDECWINVLEPIIPVEGRMMKIVLEPLGNNSTGHGFTARTTTSVVSIETIVYPED